MNTLSDLLVGLLERAGRRPASRWALRAVLAVCGLACQAWITLHAGATAWTPIGVAAVIGGVLLPRSVVPLLTAAVLIVQAVLAGLPALALVPVAVTLLGWHTCATLLCVGRPWARMSRRTLAGARMPVLASLAAIVLATAAALIAGGADLGEAGPVTFAAGFAVVLGVIVVLWPSGGDAGAGQ